MLDHFFSVMNADLVNCLKAIPIADLKKYIRKTGATPKALEDIGVVNLYDLYVTNFDSVDKKGFHKKKANDIQAAFREYLNTNADDIIFWNAPKVFPVNYFEDRAIEDCLKDVLDELIAYVDSCFERIDQIYSDRGKLNIKYLKQILRGLYKEGKSRRELAEELEFSDSENVRVIKNRFLMPLFEGKGVRISINEDLLSRLKDILFTEVCIDTYSEGDIIFVRDVLNMDFISAFGHSFVVPAREKLCYEKVLQAFFDELTAVMKPIPAETLADFIDNNEIVQRDVYGNNKIYSEDFVYSLLYNSNLTIVSNEGILIKHEYIKNNTGSIFKERALARIIADVNVPISKERIFEEYYLRYEKTDVTDSLQNCKKYGCNPQGKTHWYYGERQMMPLKDWVEDYASTQKVFLFKDILEAVKGNNYEIRTEGTIRTYITNCCAVDNHNINRFCYNAYLHDYPNDSWRRPMRYGFVNWIVNELHMLFESRGRQFLHRRIVNSYLCERAKGTEYQVESGYEFSGRIGCYPITGGKHSPFVIGDKKGKGDWELVKSEVYDETEWETFGLRGKEYEKKILALATNRLRQEKSFKLSLTSLVKDISDDVEGLNTKQIRSKLIRIINGTTFYHSLKIVPGNNMQVTIDAKRLNIAEQYKLKGDETAVKRKTISQLAVLDWEALMPVIKDELSFCKDWMRKDGLDYNYDDIFNSFISYIKTNNNRNLSHIVPQRLYEFFFVSDPTGDDRYLIMCNLAKNFEALLEGIFIDKGGIPQQLNGLYEKSKGYGYEAFAEILHRDTKIKDMNERGYEYALKYLSFVRNTDSHGTWFIDRYNITKSDDEKNIEKIRYFAALYIFTFAKYFYEGYEKRRAC